MNATKTITSGLLTVFLTGCASKWVLQDNSPAPSSQLRKAKTACKINEKLDRLMIYQAVSDAVISVSGPAAKEAAEQGMKKREQKVYAEIDDCMNEQGLKRKSK